MHTAIILSAGKGLRMGTAVPKQYLPILDRPIITYTIEAFEKSNIDEIIVVTAEGFLETFWEEYVLPYDFSKVTAVVAGGAERYDSVYAGIEAAADSDYVHIHDGARCLITPELINKMIEETEAYGAAALACPVKDTIRVADANGFGVSTPDRSTLWAMQTPQSFKREGILEAFEKMYALSGTKGVTDDVMVYETFGKGRAKLVESSYENMKITTVEDIVFAEAILRKGTLYI